ncbi:hypothetical protein CR513_45233, partial [Mucuna pruriens]
MIQDLKIQVGQLANTMSQLQSAGSEKLPSQTIPNPMGNVSIVSLRSGRELPQEAAPQQRPRPADVEFDSDAVSLVPQQARSVPLPFPTWTLSARKVETDEDLLKMFRKVEINIPLLDSIKQIPKYTKFLKELCVHKRKKMKGEMELGGVMSALTKIEIATRSYKTLPKKCRDPRIFSIPCTIGESNRSIVQPLGVLKDVLVQVKELIFPIDFYVLYIVDETSGKGSTLILGTKIDMHVGTLSMEFDDNLVQYNIFEAMRHPTKNPLLFRIDVIDELVV